jgi:hypothetical protein
MYPKLKINVYFIFLNIGDLTFGITFVSTTHITITCIQTLRTGQLCLRLSFVWGGPTAMAAMITVAAGAFMLPSTVLAYIQISIILVIVMTIT